MAASLSPAQVAQFREQGYLAPLPGLDPALCPAIRADVEGFGRRHGVKEALILRNKAHLKMPSLLPVVRHEAILDAVESVIGPDILCWGSSFFIKEPGGREVVGWHQDAYYWDIEGDVVVAWVAIIPSTLENGAMRVLPGTHRAPALPHGASPQGSGNMLFSYEEIAVEVDERQTVPCLLGAGDFSLHHMAVVHGSPPNRSADRRMGFSITYMPAKVRHMGRRNTALLVRGEDRYGHFGPEPVPAREMDPAVLAFIETQFGSAVPVAALAERPPQDFYRAKQQAA
jgi:ectoine hydroxylase-related dioxygenase (phytanoyl-CoA dioxygenase family)